MLTIAQGAAAFVLAVYLIGPAMRGEALPWQGNENAGEEVEEDEAASAAGEVEEPRHSKRKKHREQGALLPIESVIVNVAETQGRRFLKTSLTLELEAGHPSDVQARIPVLRGAVIDVLAAKNLDELVATDARSALRAEILESLNSKDEDMKFKDVFFTEFIVQ
jgi:flagellar FliL protein